MLSLRVPLSSHVMNTEVLAKKSFLKSQAHFGNNTADFTSRLEGY